MPQQNILRNRGVIALFIALFVCLLVLAYSHGGCSGASSSAPASVVKSAVLALPSHDATKVASYFTGQAHEDMLEGLTIFYAEYETISVQNVGVNLEHQGETIATVFLAYDLTVSAYGNTNTQHYQHTVQVVKLNGRWYLNSKI